MPKHSKAGQTKVEVTVSTTHKQSEDITAFLSNHAGVYLYRPLVSRVMFWFGILVLIGISIGVYELLFDGQNSIYSTVKIYVMLVLGPYFIWSCFVVALKFKEVRIDNKGIRILPFGLHIAPHEVEEIRHSENYAGAGTIELKLKSPHLIFHVVAWSWGRTLTIAFNSRLLTPVAASV